MQLIVLTAKQLCIGNNEPDAAAEENVNVSASKPSAGRDCDFAVSRHSKFVWPGIDAIVEAYASHVEGDEIC